jgi:acyl-CoA reductase-like NAD-dependent aldehyde dehydrogenase
VIAAITPFNAPVSVACHKIAPAIAGGNTIVLKPAPQGATSSLQLVELFHEAGLPPAAINLVHGGPEVGQALVTHPQVALINFTGGGRTADAIIRQVGMKRTVLELGGNGATIIHKDANVKRAVPACSVASFGLSGQSCVSLQRIYAHRDVYRQVTDGLVEIARKLKVGDPLDPEVDVGPLITQAAAIRIEEWVRDAEADGAKVLCGGQRNGSFFDPTVVVECKPEMQLVCD